MFTRGKNFPISCACQKPMKSPCCLIFECPYFNPHQWWQSWKNTDMTAISFGYLWIFWGHILVVYTPLYPNDTNVSWWVPKVAALGGAMRPLADRCSALWFASQTTAVAGGRWLGGGGFLSNAVAKWGKWSHLKWYHISEYIIYN